MRKRLDELELNISRELIDATSISEPDPSWSFTDDRWHDHKWSISEDGSANVPSCDTRLIVVGHYEDGDEIEETEYRCKECGEVIKPRWRGNVYRKFQSGLTSAFLDGVPLSESETRTVIEVMGAMRDLMP